MSSIEVSTFNTHLEKQLELLRNMVEFESPTFEKESVDRFGHYLAEMMQQRGAEVQQFPQTEAGDHWIGKWGKGDTRILLLTHIDTVHPLGSLEKMPWRPENGKVHGPGVLDMKAGISIALTAIEYLQTSSMMDDHTISLLCTSDEEIGSHTSRELIESEARNHDLVLCLEPALPDGALKTWRKGTGIFTIETRGYAAHAGANPGAGVNAIVEMTHQIQKVIQLGDPEKETSVNVGVLQGGTRSNVIPDHCLAKLDIRVKTIDEQDRLEQAFAEFEPVLDGARVQIEGEWNRPPLMRNQQMIATFQRAKKIAAQIGIDLLEGGTGGASDANFVAPLGIPVLDGFGAIGTGAHSSREHIMTASLPHQTALIAALLSEW
jgi:glutamate carboxypeptidase